MLMARSFFRVLYSTAWERKCRQNIGVTASKFMRLGHTTLLHKTNNILFLYARFPYQINAQLKIYF